MLALMNAPEAAGGGPANQRPRRPHTGRRRNDAAREAILDTTLKLLRSGGVGGLTVDAIADAAGVGRQTIYRWWPSKGAVVAEAITRHARAADLTAFLTDSFAGLDDPGTRRVLRQLAAAAQQDEHAAGVLADFTAQRRGALHALLERGRAAGQLPQATDLDMLVDLAYGFLWYRLLVGHAPLDQRAARSLAAHLIAAAHATPE
jgi:AcrR family transcriptional regulator